MSTFTGLLQELPHISVDCFDGVNSQSQLFFLSHCHMDHMKGIRSLRRTLYTSHISAIIVRKKFPHIRDIVPLEFGAPTALKYKNPFKNDEELTVVVTALPAGHMLGSIMLHFQTADHHVLYTGDFRLKLSDLGRIKLLKTMAETRSINKSVYVDSTFFRRQWPEFPPQRESITKIIELIREWVEKSTKYVVHLQTPATYGSELLFQEIVRALHRKIHVGAAVFEQYQYIPSMDGVTCTNPSGLQIHACYGPEKEACLKEVREAGLLRIIRPSALFWENWETGKAIFEPSKYRSYEFRVCYSNHASFQEVRDLLLYLKADRVYLNVENSAVADEMQSLKASIMSEYLEGGGAKEETFCPFKSEIGKFSFSTSQPLGTRLHNGDLDVDTDFVVALPKRRKGLDL